MSKEITPKKQFVLYDSRYLTNEDSASVYCCADTIEEAREDREDMFPDAIIVEYDVEDNELINGKVVN